MSSPNSFATLFKRYRLRSEMLTLSQFADAASQEEGLYYDQSLYTKWQQGKRTPKDRSLILKLIHLFTTHGGITTLEQANSLLTSVGLMRLSEGECKQIEKGSVHFAQQSGKIATLEKCTLSIGALVAKTLQVKLSRLTLGVLVVASIWYGRIWIAQMHEGVELSMWILFYGLLAVLGVAHLTQQKSRTGHISKAALFFALGLLGQGIGLMMWVVYNHTGVAIPYPSWADVGYASIIPMYIIGSFYFIGNRQVDLFVQGMRKKESLLFLAPLLILTGGYIFYLSQVGLPLQQQATIILNTLYPLGEIAPIMIISYGYILNKKYLARAEKFVYMTLIVALLMQFATEYSFVISAQLNTYINGGFVDYMYAISYFVMSMTIGLLIQARHMGFFAFTQKLTSISSPNPSFEAFKSAIHHFFPS